jgi:hypothetical protein
VKPTQGAKRWSSTAHCQKNATRHGAYSARVFSTRAFLRTLDKVLERLEAEVRPNRDGKTGG